MTKEGQLRVWHIPQVPMQAFYVEVETIAEAKKILNLLADYDSFEFENKIKPDYSNVQGLEVFEEGEWVEFYDDDDRDINEIMRDEEPRRRGK